MYLSTFNKIISVIFITSILNETFEGINFHAQYMLRNNRILKNVPTR